MEQPEAVALELGVRPDVLHAAARQRRISLFFPESTNLQLGDIVLLQDGDETLRAEVASVKLTRFVFLRPEDLNGFIPEHRTPADVLRLLRRMTGEPLEPVDCLKVIELVTLTYDLNELNRIVMRDRRRRS